MLKKFKTFRFNWKLVFLEVKIQNFEVIQNPCQGYFHNAN